MYKVLFRSCLIFISAILISLISFLLYLNYQLSKGPIPLDFLAKRFETYVSELSPDFEFKLESLKLTKSDSLLPFEFLLEGLNISNEKGEKLTTIKQLGVQFSYWDLIWGRFVPHEIDLQSGHLKIARNAQNQITVGFQKLGSNESTSETSPFVFFLTPEFVMQDFESFIGRYKYIENLSLQKISIDYTDHVEKIHVTIPELNLKLKHQGQHVLGHYDFDMVYDQKTVNFKGDCDYNKKLDYFTLETMSDHLSLHSLPLALKHIKESDYIDDLALTANYRYSLHYDLRAHDMISRLKIQNANGFFLSKSFFPKKIDLEGLDMSLTYKSLDHSLTVDTLSFDSAEGHVNAKSKIVFAETKRPNIKIDAELLHFQMRDLPNYWPKPLAIVARDWVLSNIKEGTANKATISVRLSGKEDSFRLRRLNGTIDYEDLDVNYFKPLPIATKVKGHITYDRDNFDIDIHEGIANTIPLKNTKVLISGLSGSNQAIAIDVEADGPLDKSLQFIEKEPLNFLSQYPISLDRLSGSAHTKLHLDFPLSKSVSLKDVKIQLQSALTKTGFKEVAPGINIENSALNLILDNDKMTLTGKPHLNGAETDIEWTEYFNPQNGIKQSLKASGPFMAEDLYQLIPDLQDKASGPLSLSMTMTNSLYKSNQIDASFDLQKTKIDLPDFQYQKAKNSPLSGTAQIIRENGEKLSFMKLDIKGKDVAIDGKFVTDPETKKVLLLQFPQFKIGDSDIAIDLYREPSDIYQINVTGSLFDFDGFWKKRKDLLKSDSDDEADFDLNLVVDRLRFKNRDEIKDLSLKALHRNNHYQSFDLKAKTPLSDKNIEIALKKDKAENRMHFHANIEDIGQLLRSMDLYTSMYNGKLLVDGTADMTDTHYKGIFELTNYQLKGDLPLFAKIANLLSIDGLSQTIENKGIVFKSSHGDYQWKNNLLGVDNMTTQGSSLGLTARGNLNFKSEWIEAEGTVVPMHSMNHVIGSIPVVGDLLIGKSGEGIFAANYQIKGSLENPKMKVSAASLLTPGIIRRLFFAGSTKSFDEHLQTSEKNEQSITNKNNNLKSE